MIKAAVIYAVTAPVSGSSLNSALATGARFSPMMAISVPDQSHEHEGACEQTLFPRVQRHNLLSHSDDGTDIGHKGEMIIEDVHDEGVNVQKRVAESVRDFSSDDDSNNGSQQEP
jgi:hypothetical protein